MKFARLLLRRVAQGLLLVLAVIVLNFVLVHAAPGDPVETIAGASGGMSPELMAQLRTQYGLDKPLVVQLGVYLAKVVSGDLGYSYFFNLPVVALIVDRVPATLLLVISAVLLAFFVGTTLGVLSARKPNGLLSQSITVLSLVGFAAPVFWMGIMLVILFASIWPILPVSGMRDIQSSGGGWRDVVDVLHHLILPTVTLALVYLAQYSWLARSSMLDVLGADFIRTARAKGLPERVVLYKHALRNALLPVVTVLGLQFGNVLAGAILVETVFNWPGLGRLAFEAVLRRDYPTVLGVLLFASVVVLVMNQLTDLAYR
ncbi:MAG: ABC transporter permease, partial [Pseudomonadota bacterium]|nr:ABC transporter permease [Pseudomonadota bacterium]